MFPDDAKLLAHERAKLVAGILDETLAAFEERGVTATAERIIAHVTDAGAASALAAEVAEVFAARTQRTRFSFMR